MYDLFSDFFDGFDIFSQPVTYKQAQKCPLCSRTYSDFEKTGKFGCGECYKTFKAPAASVLRQIHHNPVHIGKIPSKSGDAIKQKRQYERLKNELAEAVKKEDYETAAKLHKQVRKMEEEMKKQK